MAETAAQMMKKVAEATLAQKAASTSSEKQSLDSSTVTVTESGSSSSSEIPPTFAEENRLTPEQLAEQEETLRAGIERGMEWFEEAKDADFYAGLTVKEKAFSRLLDPLVWSMREALVTFEHEDCEECKNRRETGGNSYGVVVAEMLLGRYDA